jgi:uncharacterized protein
MPDVDTRTAPEGESDVVVAAQVRQYRQAVDYVERHVLARATSVDGVRFTFQASLHDLALKRGGYALLQSGSRTWLGQVTDVRVDTQVADRSGPSGGSDIRVSLAVGEGIVLDPVGLPFHGASAREATQDEVRAWASPSLGRAGLTVGELRLAPGVPATLDSGGLARHTFMCGQSGSGKTYSLGVLLERVLAETSLRIVILDPNSDYVGLGDVRGDADPDLVRRYQRVPAEIAVWRDDPGSEHPLRLQFSDLSPATQAAVMGLHPVEDRDEYAVLADLVRSQEDGRPLVAGPDQLLSSEVPGARQLGIRASNLGVLDWRIWSRGESPSLVAELRHPTARCTIVDTGSLADPQQQRVVSAAVLETLWRSRAAHEPCLVVVDEAHNVCPASPGDAVSRLSTETTMTIAAEGRKFGLYLLISTQQPHKVHENIVSQCDNLLLMRMNSAADLADLEGLFSFVEPGLIAGATSFGMGDALVAGKVIAQPAYVRMGKRLTREGGADIPMTWAAPRVNE